MDNLRAGARELAEQSLEKAYADVLENLPDVFCFRRGRAESICHQIYGRAAEAVCRRYLGKNTLVTKIVIKF